VGLLGKVFIILYIIAKNGLYYNSYLCYNLAIVKENPDSAHMTKLENFTKINKAIFWDSTNLKTLSEEKILERTLNYAPLSCVKKLFDIIGRKKAAKIFFLQLKKKRSNYRPEIKNLFKIVLKKYV